MAEPPNTHSNKETLKSNESIQVESKDAYTKAKETIIMKIERNQLRLSSALLVVLFILHQLPQYNETTQKFIQLQYGYPNTSYYDIGVDDSYFVLYWIVFLTLIRSLTMNYFFKPLAAKFNSTSNKAQTRFAEQGWSLAYYTISFFVGFTLYYNSPYWLNCDNFYINWPHTRLSGSIKCYYLIQTAFWLQQIFVLNVEARRKDHYQMFSHHIITCLLVIGSYYYYFTRIGHVILVIMDCVDIFLAAAKMLKYCGFSTLCDLMFLMFLFSWIALRHGVYNYILVHHFYYAKALNKAGECIDGLIQKRCWNDLVLGIFFTLLVGLQIITIIWMVLILKVAWKVIRGKGADDVRSDADDTDKE